MLLFECLPTIFVTLYVITFQTFVFSPDLLVKRICVFLQLNNLLNSEDRPEKNDTVQIQYYVQWQPWIVYAHLVSLNRFLEASFFFNS
jgi:hypothetical protein